MDHTHNVCFKPTVLKRLPSHAKCQCLTCENDHTTERCCIAINHCGYGNPMVETNKLGDCSQVNCPDYKKEEDNA